MREVKRNMTNEIVDIQVIIDEKYIEPLVNIYTRKETEQVIGIIDAIENASRNRYASIKVYDEGRLKLISQRDIFRIRTENRSTLLDTAEDTYTVKDSLTNIERLLDEERFFRISQSEIINLYKVDYFDFTISGTICVHFDNEQVSWVARRCVRPLKDKLKKI